MVDLISRLRALSRYEHSDYSIGDEAANALEAAREDAARWRHARKLLTIDDIEGAQGAFDSFGGLISEDECVRADVAIDAAREARNG